MISNKQRREVARSLRVEANYWRDYRKDEDISCMSDQQFTEGALTAFGFEDLGMPVYELFDYLADLVDCPTCEMKGRPGERYAICTRCGAFVRRDAVTDCFGVIPVKFCPNCRSEVFAGAV